MRYLLILAGGLALFAGTMILPVPVRATIGGIVLVTWGAGALWLAWMWKR